MAPGTNKGIIQLSDVTRTFGAFYALRKINAEIREGEFFSLLGPSGCGKTTLLRLIAGFDEPTSGAISIGGRPMAGIAANKRPTNMVFQSYAIFPHLNVAENVGYGLTTRKLSKAEIAAEVEKALAMVDLQGFGGRAAHELSGGQRQRVAIARATIMRPAMLLADEPTGNLDRATGHEVTALLEALNAAGTTLIVVTHDPAMGERARRRILMEDGAIRQELQAAAAAPEAPGSGSTAPPP